VAEHTSRPFWFQLYVMRDEDFLHRLIERARAAGCSALVLTLDLQILGQRHRDHKNGLSAPPKLTPATLLDLATKWGWGLEMLGTKRRGFGNIVGHARGVGDAASLMSWTTEQFDPRLDWDKIRRIKELWGGKLILKGILDAEDARMAAEIGADAILVSNHGGRQLDGALSSIRLDVVINVVTEAPPSWRRDARARSNQFAHRWHRSFHVMEYLIPRATRANHG
jgi:L-lactate dehydrogenase (cytochrome)